MSDKGSHTDSRTHGATNAASSDAIVIAKVGPPEVMRLVSRPDVPPGAGQIAVQVAAAGVNFIDTYHRTGLYPLDLPATLGMEGAGTVVEVGEGVEHPAEGDHVAWATAAGSYAQRVVMPALSAVVVPENVDLQTAAAVPLQGFTAHYLATDCPPLKPGDRCLVHAGAGGAGRLLVQMPNCEERRSWPRWAVNPRLRWPLSRSRPCGELHDHRSS